MPNIDAYYASYWLLLKGMNKWSYVFLKNPNEMKQYICYVPCLAIFICSCVSLVSASQMLSIVSVAQEV